MSDASDGIIHEVQQGESTTRLAFEHGLFWKTVWQHEKNADLRHLRKEPNVLLAGDEIFLPNIRLKDESGGTEKKHRFRRKGIPEKLNVRFLDLEGQPYASKPYKLTMDGKTSKGSLDGDGWLRVPIPPDAQQAHIEVGKSGEYAVVDMDLGQLDPVSELTGVQARLRNLGFYSGALDGQMSEPLAAAIAEFRVKYDLEAKSEVDDPFRDKLKEVHGV